MIRSRDTKPKWIVSLRDEALDGIKENSNIRLYAETRDPKHIGLDVSTGIVEKTGKTATMFLVEPLRQEYSGMAEKESRSPISLMAVFASHVVDVKFCEFSFSRTSDRVSDSFLSQMPQDTISEIATVIIEMATGGGRGSHVPFSLPDGYWAERQSSLNLSALLARTESANDKKTGMSRETGRENTQQE